MRQLSEKRIRKPFFDARYSDGIEKMSEQELTAAVTWLDQNFKFIR